MNFFDNYYTVGSKIKTKAARQEYFTAIIEYYYTGQEPNFRYDTAEIAFEGIRFSLQKSMHNAANRRKTNRKRNANESKRKTENETVSSGEKEGNTSKEVLLEEESNPLNPPFDFDPDEERFPWSCLAALNEVLGTSYASMPPKCERTLSRFEGKYPVGDVREMVAYKRDEWQGTRFSNCLTPNTLFSPDHFEQYMNQSRGSAAEKRTYEQYD